MKTKRLLAALLCVMMVLTSLPMIAFATTMPDIPYVATALSTGGTATSTTVKDSIAEAAGVSAVEPISGQDFQFASGFNATATGITSPSGATYTDENGLSIPGGSVVWKYHADTTNGWSPLSPPAVATVFEAKVPADGILIFQACKHGSHDRSFVQITPESVWVCQGDGSGGFAGAPNLFEFVPGNDWVEYMVMANANGGYDVYVKGGNAIADKWHLLVSTTSYRPNGGWKSTGINLTGAGTNGAQVKYVTVYKEGTASGGGETVWEGDYENISDILGYAVKPVDGQDFQFANGFGSSTAYVTTPSGATYDNTNGLDLTGVTTELAGASWVYKPSASWGPFTGDPKNSMTFRAKVETGGSLTVQSYYNSGVHSRLYMTIDDEAVNMGNATTWTGVEKEFDFVPGTDWADYLVMINESNGFDVYVKAATTGNKWKLLASETTWRSGSNQTGIAISGTYADKTGKTSGGYIQYLTVYEKDASGGGGTGGGGGTTPPAGSDDPYEGTQGKITDVLGSDAVAIKTFQIGGEFNTSQAGISAPAGGVYSDSMGVKMGAASTWKYLPANGWTPLSSKGVTFGAKLATGDTMVFQCQKPGSNADRAYVNISNGNIWVSCSNGSGGFTGATNANDYVPGTGWNDYAVRHNENNGYDFYAKKPEDETWTLVASSTSYRPGGGATTGLNFYSANGGSYLKYTTVYGTAAELPEEEGPAAGEQYTIEEIIGGIAVAKEELIFDNNFNGVEANAQLKNVTTGAVEATQPTVGANGLELKNTAGKYFAWNSGSENMWKPLTKSNPVMFRAKVDVGGMLGVQLNGYPRASVYIYPNKLVAWGSDQKEATGFTPGTDWVNYLITSDGENFRVYTKLDEEEKWTVRVTSNGFRSGGYYGVLLDNTTTNNAYISEIKQYKVERMVLTDTNTIAGMTNTVYVDEDFSEDEGTYNMITGKIEDGVFRRDPDVPSDPTYPDSSRLDVDLGTINPKGLWFVRFKYRIPSADAVMSVDMQNNGNKIAIDCHDDYVFIINRTSAVSKSEPMAAAGVGNWAELLFAWNDNAKVNVYWHKVGEDEWIKTHTDFVPGTASSDDIRFHCRLDSEIDDIKVYSGDYLKIEEPELASGVVKTSGEYFTGTLDTPYDRRATLVTAVYDETYGYTKFVKSKEYEVRSGVGANLANTFTTTGVDETNDTAAVMLWDTLETGIPLGDMAGVALQNNATGSAGNAAVGIKAEANYNDIKITGYTGVRNGRITISVVDEGGVLRAAGQTVATGTGLIDTSVAVDPTCPSGTYTVRVQYGTSVATESTVNLFCDDIPYNSITDVASMRSFINNYGSETAKKWNAEEGFAAEVYDRYVEAKGSTTTFTSLYEFRSAMDVATNEEVRERQMCLEINTAAKTGKWSEVKKLIMETYADDLGFTSEDIAGISNSKDLFLRVGSDNASIEDVQADFRTAIATQKAVEAATGGMSGGGGGTGGGGGIASDNKYTQTGAGVSGGGFGGGAAPTPVEKPAEFTDLDSVSWAKESIQALRGMGVISGNGDGTFAPDRAVTREEFLKMVLQAAGISAKDAGAVTFRDVDANAWYYSYVATAYQLGIITGQSEEEFGIGQQITRSDMAVIIKRVLDYNKIEMAKTVTPFVFADFDTIPQYAEESVDALVRAGLMNGVGNNEFAGTASATRAESAVAIYRIYNYMAERR